MTVRMPRSGFDLRQTDIPPRWEGLTDFDKALPGNRTQEYSAGIKVVGLWGRVLTIAVLTTIVAVFGYLSGAAVGIW